MNIVRWRPPNPSMIARRVCFQEAAKRIPMSEFRREADVVDWLNEGHRKGMQWGTMCRRNETVANRFTHPL